MQARRLAAVIAACVLALGAAPAADARLLVGLGDQGAQTFRAPGVRKLPFRVARLNLAWDWYRHPWMVAQTADWMAAVRAAQLRPMVALGRNWGPGGGHRLPRMGAYLRGFRQIRTRYPFVRDFSAWNEPNVRDQPTVHKAWAAARYFDALVAACPHRCTIVGGDVGDNGAMRPWLQAYQRRLRHRPKVWALHNYHDANERTGSTARFLRLVRGPVWLTETGGVKRRVGLRGQRRAVARVFAIARSSRRIRRVYFYQWRYDRSHTWDSAFLNADGSKRPAYRELVRGMRGR
jgi:Glycosyl hydrolase catalytic core